MHYDWLVFTCGVQYQSPILKGIPPPKCVFSPGGVVSIKGNVIVCCHGACTFIIVVMCPTGPCVVYGCGVDSYCMVNDLLVQGVAPDMITLVQPTIPTCFDDEIVSSRVSQTLSLCGVRVLTGYVLSGWETCDDSLSAVQLVDLSGVPLTVHCTSMVYMGEKTVDRYAFKGIYLYVNILC